MAGLFSVAGLPCVQRRFPPANIRWIGFASCGLRGLHRVLGLLVSWVQTPHLQRVPSLAMAVLTRVWASQTALARVCDQRWVYWTADSLVYEYVQRLAYWVSLGSLDCVADCLQGLASRLLLSVIVCS